MERKPLIAVPLVCLVTLVAWLLRPKHELLGEAFISERDAPLLSGIAEVRERVGTLHYGERVDVLARHNEYAKVRTNAGAIGWIYSSHLMEPAPWPRTLKPLSQPHATPVHGPPPPTKPTHFPIPPS